MPVCILPTELTIRDNAVMPSSPCCPLDPEQWYFLFPADPESRLLWCSLRSSFILTMVTVVLGLFYLDLWPGLVTVLPRSPPAHCKDISTIIHPSQSCPTRAVESISLCATLKGHVLGEEILLRKACLTQSARNEFSQGGCHCGIQGCCCFRVD